MSDFPLRHKLGRGVADHAHIGALDDAPSPVSPFQPNPNPIVERPRAERIERVSVRRVRRLTGGFPDGRNSTLTMGNVAGTDLGHMFTQDGTLYMVFGDTYGQSSTLPPSPQVPPEALKAWRSNTMAVIDEPASLLRVGLEEAAMITSGENYARELIPGQHGPNDGSSEVTKIPTNGIAVDGLMILHVMSVKHWIGPGYWLVDHSALYYTHDPNQNWVRSDVWWEYGNFAQVAFVHHGPHVYLFGIPPGRYGEVKLARVSADAILDPDGYRYFRDGEWIVNHEDASAIVRRPVGELSVIYNEFLERWIMLHIQPGFRDPADPRFSGQPAIVVREAPDVTGPWSDPAKAAWPDGYGPFMHPSLVQNRGAVVYFTLSFWNAPPGPDHHYHYNVHLMEASFNTDPTVALTADASPDVTTAALDDPRSPVGPITPGGPTHVEGVGDVSVEPTRIFRVATLLVRWRQQEPRGFPPLWYENFFCNSKEPGIAGFWWWQTQGQVGFDGRVVGWFDLDTTPDELVELWPSGTRVIGRAQIANLAVRQAMEQGFDPRGFDGFVVITDVDPPDGWGGVNAGATTVDTTATIGGGIISVRVTGKACVLPVGSVFDFSAHEFGHVVGLDHSFGPSTFDDDTHQPGEYGHHACIMSASSYGGSDSQYDLGLNPPEMSSKGPALNGATRVARGWARNVEMRLEPGLRTVQTLISLNAPPENSAVRAIHIVRGPDETYTVDFRTPTDRYERTLLCPMVMIHQLRGSTADRAHPGTDSATYLGEIHAEAPMPFDGPGFRIELLDIIEGRVAVVRVIDRSDVPQPPSPTIPAVYGRQPTGELLWYRHEGHYNASGIWNSRPVDEGLKDLRMFSGRDGVLYAIDPTGDLRWRKHNAHQSGERAWTDWVPVGDGWNMYPTVFCNGHGEVYGVEPNGDLYWYRHHGYETGNRSWTNRLPVGDGWNVFRAIIPAGGGVIYGLHPDGALLWYQHVGHADGTPSWQGPRTVDTGWEAFGSVFATETGIIYSVVAANGDLQWRRHDGRSDGSQRWTGPKRVGGPGWEAFDFLATS